MPVANPELEKSKIVQLLEGELPSSVSPPQGCVFNTRCPIAGEECSASRPAEKIINAHSVSCFKVN